MGYHRAGFEVTGVDIDPQLHYPFEFIQADALTLSIDFLRKFDAIHASPPCQKFSLASVRHVKEGKEYPDCLTPIRYRLINADKPWVIENVLGAPMSRMMVLCGLMFDLKVFRHRAFESNVLLFSPAHPPHAGKRIGEGYFSVAGGAGRWKSWGKVIKNVSKGTIKEWRDAMGIDWMTGKEIKEAIPPAYCEFIGSQLISYLHASGRLPVGFFPERKIDISSCLDHKKDFPQNRDDLSGIASFERSYQLASEASDANLLLSGKHQDGKDSRRDD